MRRGAVGPACSTLGGCPARKRSRSSREGCITPSRAARASWNSTVPPMALRAQMINRTAHRCALPAAGSASMMHVQPQLSKTPLRPPFDGKRVLHPCNRLGSLGCELSHLVADAQEGCNLINRLVRAAAESASGSSRERTVRHNGSASTGMHGAASGSSGLAGRQADPQRGKAPLRRPNSAHGQDCWAMVR